MGQSTSIAKSHPKSQEPLTKQQVVELFQARALQTLKPAELSLLTSKLNVTSLDDSCVVTLSDLAFLLQLSNDKDKDILSIHKKFSHAARILYHSCNVLGNLPFLNDGFTGTNEGQLTIKRLIVASLVHTGRISSFWSNSDYLKLLFISLASIGDGCQSTTLTEKSSVKSEKTDLPLYPLQLDTSELISLAEKARSISWNDFNHLTNYDGVDVESLKVSADVMVKVLTLLLVVKSIRLQSHNMMQLLLQQRISDSWSKFELVAVSLVRYMNIDISALNLEETVITYHQLQNASSVLLHVFSLFERLFSQGFLGLIVADPKKESPPHPTPKIEKPKHKQYSFEETRLVNDATLAILSTALQSAGVISEISRESVVELYNGSHAGFSIRSLELKIFKWQAPTLFLISGKRLRSKTTSQNKRYQQFDTEYPKFFRSTENPKKYWQTETDRITYAVYVQQPWRNSNKANFGDESSVIVNILPRFDIFTSKHDPRLKGQLVYFNNLGMGIGFGNDQPVNKNNVRKILPGKVSLTVEANLEFAVFRHIINSSAITLGYFNFSHQETALLEDYEDRFMVTDLEVWGVGSDKELEEQKKQWEWEEKQAQARQSVNIDTLKEDRAFLEMAGLVGGHTGGGSM